MTDEIGDCNTVVAEMEIESLTEFERMMADYKFGRGMERMDAQTKQEMSKYTETYLTGRREVYQIVK